MKGYKSKHSIRIPSNKKQQTVVNSSKLQKKENKKQEVKKKDPTLSNHERIIAQRAKKAGMTVELYKTAYPKGYTE